MTPMKRLLVVFLLLLLATPLLAVPLLAEDGEVDTESETAGLSERYRNWLDDVALLLTDTEREVFLSLRQDYQRDHFIRRFWKSRDPYPDTRVNELQVTWEAGVEVAREELGSLESEAARALLYLGPPTNRQRLSCAGVMESINVWVYEDGASRVAGYFTLVFVGSEAASFRLWEPSDGLRRLLHPGRGAAASRPSDLSVDSSDRQAARTILRECIRGDDIISALAQALPFSEVEDKIEPTRVSTEWVQAFKARSTDVAEGVEPLTAQLDLSFPGRHQSRTVVQGLIAVKREDAAPTEGNRFYNLVLDGEVLRKGELFDNFRMRFDFAAANAPATLPIVAQRYLRPGEYELILKVEDLGSKRVFRQQMDLQVPVFDPAVHRVAVAPPTAPVSAAPEASADGEPVVFTSRLAEANATISTGDHTIKIMALPDTLATGNLRVSARTRGDGIAKVAFELNGVEKLRKTRPPYSVELDLGNKPRFHTLRALALDNEGDVLAVDEVIVNGGPHRFSVRLLSPQPGQTYSNSVRAHAEVEVPESERLDRVELFLNEDRVATLFQPPFEHPILLTQKAATDIAYVRAVAYLRSGAMDEDIAVINAPDFIDDYQVNFVELFTTVTDRDGDFVEDLDLAEVKVLEDGEPQEVRRFERVRDLPINAGLIIDTSTSMLRLLNEVEKAAHRFLEDVLTERDRAALITFNDAPTLQVRFTSDTEILAGGLAGLVAEGETALYDSIIYGLHYFSGMRGKRAVVVLTDGEDSSSRYSYRDTLEFARQTGVAIYLIGIGLPSEPQSRAIMRELAKETGGDTFFIERVSHLEKVYESIQLELRSQYLVAYQSSSKRDVEEFREVEVVIDRKGVEAKTISGYYP